MENVCPFDGRTAQLWFRIPQVVTPNLKVHFGVDVRKQYIKGEFQSLFFFPSALCAGFLYPDFSSSYFGIYNPLIVYSRTINIRAYSLLVKDTFTINDLVRLVLGNITNKRCILKHTSSHKVEQNAPIL